MEKPTTHFYEFGPFRLDMMERLLLRDGEPVPLTPKAFDTLLTLVQNSGHILEKGELMQRVWPDTIVEEANLAQHISALRKALGESPTEPQYIKTVPRRGYRFVAKVRETREECTEYILEEHSISHIIIEEARTTPQRNRVARERPKPSDDLSQMPQALALITPQAKLEPIGGAIPLDSEFYIVRPADEEFLTAIARQDSIVLVKGARQMGKTSLLARGLHRARQRGAKVVVTDFQDLGAADLASAERLFLALGESIAEQLDLDESPASIWDAEGSANRNFDRYVRRDVLQKIAACIVWGLDEVDRLFPCPFGSEVFGLFRSWHNKRSLDPAGPWQRLTLAIAYATEAHLFITDPNQSPFNVGTRLTLEDFTAEQTVELNWRYGSPLQNAAQAERFYALVGGHPYLTQKGLYKLAHGMDQETFEALADRDEGPLGDHLRPLFQMLTKDQALCDAVRQVLNNQPCPSAESFYRLRSAGILTGDSARTAMPRCQLYARYLGRQLL